MAEIHTPKIFSYPLVIMSDFGVASRWTATTGDGGTASFAQTNGCALQTNGTANGRVSIQLNLDLQGNTNYNPFNNNPTFNCLITNANPNPTTGDGFIGLGTPTLAGSGLTFTTRHIGFKFTANNAATTSLYATNGNGTSQTETLLDTLAANDNVALSFAVSPTAIKFYYRKNNGAGYSVTTTHTTNIPTTVSTANDCTLTAEVTNKNTAVNFTLICGFVHLMRQEDLNN